MSKKEKSNVSIGLYLFEGLLPLCWRYLKIGEEVSVPTSEKEGEDMYRSTCTTVHVLDKNKIKVSIFTSTYPGCSDEQEVGPGYDIDLPIYSILYLLSFRRKVVT